MYGWYEENRDKHFAKHGLAFENAYEVFENVHAVIPSKHPDGDRMIAVGMMSGRNVAVIYTMRGGDYWIISIRGSRKNERKQYQALFSK